MTGNDLKSWREKVGLTQQQFADRLGVSRVTVQNWEGADAVPQPVATSCEIWEHRLKQENPSLGPVTLVYADGPMFVNPYGPRSRPALMQQEPYPTNTTALARVQQLWGSNNFHNPFIIEQSGEPLWNVVELQRVVDGGDRGSPTLENLLRAIANRVRENSAHFVRDGAKAPTPSEVKARQMAIEAQAAELDHIAVEGLQKIVEKQRQIESVFSMLLRLGAKAPDALVRAVAQALEVFDRNRISNGLQETRLEQGGFVTDYRGYEISWPQVRVDGSRWTVNLAARDRYLVAKLGGRALVFNDPSSIESAVQQAKLHVDAILDGGR